MELPSSNRSSGLQKVSSGIESKSIQPFSTTKMISDINLGRPVSTVSSPTSPPGSLTPIGITPLPFSSTQVNTNVLSEPNIPVVSMASPRTEPSMIIPLSRKQDLSNLAQQLSSIQISPPSPQPAVIVPPTPPLIVLMPQPIVTIGTPRSALPSVGPIINIPQQTVVPQTPRLSPPSVQLPSVTSVNLPNVGNVTFAQVPSVVLPNIGVIPSVSGLHLTQPKYLNDNETVDLIWNLPDIPRPLSASSTYRVVGCISDDHCFFHSISKGLSEVYKSFYRMFKQISEETLQRFEASVNNRIAFPNMLFDHPRNSVNLQENYNIIYVEAFRNLIERCKSEYVRIIREDFANKILTNTYMQSLVLARLSGSIESKKQEIMATSKVTDEEANNLAINMVLRNLANELLGYGWVQPDFMILLSDYANVDIYLLRDRDLKNPNPKATPLYGGTSLHVAVRGPKNMRLPNDPSKDSPDRPSIILISFEDNHYEIVGRIDERNIEGIIERQIVTNFTQEEPIIRRLYQMLINLRL